MDNSSKDNLWTTPRERQAEAFTVALAVPWPQRCQKWMEVCLLCATVPFNNGLQLSQEHPQRNQHLKKWNIKTKLLYFCSLSSACAHIWLKAQCDESLWLVSLLCSLLHSWMSNIWSKDSVFIISFLMALSFFVLPASASVDNWAVTWKLDSCECTKTWSAKHPVIPPTIQATRISGWVCRDNKYCT